MWELREMKPSGDWEIRRKWNCLFEVRVAFNLLNMQDVGQKIEGGGQSMSKGQLCKGWPESPRVKPKCLVPRDFRFVCYRFRGSVLFRFICVYRFRGSECGCVTWTYCVVVRSDWWAPIPRTTVPRDLRAECRPWEAGCGSHTQLRRKRALLPVPWLWSYHSTFAGRDYYIS